MGIDGTTLKISLGYFCNYLTLHIWSHDSEIKKRGLEEINIIFNKLLDKFGLTIDL